MKQHLAGHKFHNKQEVETAVHKWLQMEEPNFFCNVTKKLVTAGEEMHQYVKDLQQKIMMYQLHLML